MLLLDMIAADAASKHGHQSSPLRAASPASNASFFQMPLSILGSVLRAQSPSPSPATAVTSIPSNPRANDRDASTLPNHAMKTAHHEPNVNPAPQRPLSWSSDAESEKPRKRTPRSKTSYNLARPVHTRSKLHTRPRVLLQLHQIIASHRPPISSRDRGLQLKKHSSPSARRMNRPSDPSCIFKTGMRHV